ncbi:MAG: putative manganese-dependent inorganic diphosphatase [Thermoanaerobacteraceae bacterium]|nr:putative manganese-dependent inorganic diphosphatase [Thermoanaerobacteraceae bacterium]
MDSRIYIIGHKNPDTDSICSAIAYAYFKRQHSGMDAVPCRLGPVNAETRFVLNYFGLEEPEYIENVYTQIRDINYDRPLSVNGAWPMLAAWQLMQESGIRTVCVVDDSGKFLGLATLGDLAKVYLSQMNSLEKFSIPVNNAASVLSGEIITPGKGQLGGSLMVAAMSLDEVVKRICPGDTIIVGDRPYIQKAAIEYGAGALIITGGIRPDDDIIELSRKHGVSLILVPCGTFDTVKYISQSIPISYIMKDRDIVSFTEDDYIHEVTNTMSRYKYRNFPVIDESGAVIGLISRRHVLDYEAKKVILVDHNEFSQTVDGINEANILEIIDHHRLGGVATDKPILFKNQPVGCTSTIIYEIYEDAGVMPPSEIAGIMCAAIISDTLIFKSPTCTPKDIEAAHSLASIAGIDIKSFAGMMFKEGTSLDGKSPEDIFFTDFKEFHVDDFTIGVGQINVLADPGNIKRDILSYMKGLKEKGGYDVLLLMLTNIIDEGSEVLWVSDYRDILERAFSIDIDSDSFYLPGVVSRKNQVIPPIIRAVKSLQK